MLKNYLNKQTNEYAGAGSLTPPKESRGFLVLDALVSVPTFIFPLIQLFVYASL